MLLRNSKTTWLRNFLFSVWLALSINCSTNTLNKSLTSELSLNNASKLIWSIVIPFINWFNSKKYLKHAWHCALLFTLISGSITYMLSITSFLMCIWEYSRRVLNLLFWKKFSTENKITKVWNLNSKIISYLQVESFQRNLFQFFLRFF